MSDLLLVLMPERLTVQAGEKHVIFSRTEFRFRTILISAPGRVVGRQERMDRGIVAVVAERTINVHVKAIRRKLGEHRLFLSSSPNDDGTQDEAGCGPRGRGLRHCRNAHFSPVPERLASGRWRPAKFAAATLKTNAHDALHARLDLQTPLPMMSVATLAGQLSCHDAPALLQHAEGQRDDRCPTLQHQVAGENSDGTRFPFDEMHRPIEADVELSLLHGTMQQRGIAFIDVEVRFIAGHIGLQPTLQCQHGRLNRMIVLDELLKVSAGHGRPGQKLGQFGPAAEGGKRCGPLSFASQSLCQLADFMKRRKRRPGQVGIPMKLAFEPRVRLSRVREQRQTVFTCELVYDGLSPMHELSAELDGMTCQGPASENTSTNAIACLQADCGARGLHQLPHRKHARRAGTDDYDIDPTWRRPRMSRKRLHMRS